MSRGFFDRTLRAHFPSQRWLAALAIGWARDDRLDRRSRLYLRQSGALGVMGAGPAATRSVMCAHAEAPASGSIRAWSFLKSRSLRRASAKSRALSFCFICLPRILTKA